MKLIQGVHLIKLHPLESLGRLKDTSIKLKDTSAPPNSHGCAPAHCFHHVPGRQAYHGTMIGRQPGIQVHLIQLSGGIAIHLTCCHVTQVVETWIILSTPVSNSMDTSLWKADLQASSIQSP